MMDPSAPFRIFLAEDNPGDIVLFEEALRLQNIAFELTICGSGDQCLEQLGGIQYRPALFVIDLNLPKITGFDLIERIRSLPQFNKIPVVVWTSSRAERDRTRSMALGANEFLTKPAHLDEFLDVVGSGVRRMLSGNIRPSVAHRCSKREFPIAPNRRARGRQYSARFNSLLDRPVIMGDYVETASSTLLKLG